MRSGLSNGEEFIISNRIFPFRERNIPQRVELSLIGSQARHCCKFDESEIAYMNRKKINFLLILTSILYHLRTSPITTFGGWNRNLWFDHWLRDCSLYHLALPF